MEHNAIAGLHDEVSGCSSMCELNLPGAFFAQPKPTLDRAGTYVPLNSAKLQQHLGCCGCLSRDIQRLKDQITSKFLLRGRSPLMQLLMHNNYQK